MTTPLPDLPTESLQSSVARTSRLDSLPDPATLLPPAVVEANKILISYHEANIFASNPQGNCWFDTDVIVYCTETTCIFWQNTDTPAPDHVKVLKFLLLLDEYVKLAAGIMNYDIATAPSFRQYTGSDGIERKVVIELNDGLCQDYGGASYNGQLWAAVTKNSYQFSADTIDDVKPLMHQVFFYEAGRAVYDIVLDDILDWQMQNPSEWGYWTLGFNGAMTVLAPEHMGVELEYYGQDTAAFRQDRLNDLATYVNDSQYTFNNTWCSYLFPWNQNQSVNDMMSGLLIYLADNYGGLEFLTRLFYRLKQQSPTPNKTDRKARAKNLYRAARQAAIDLNGILAGYQMTVYFKYTLRWTFV